MWVYTRHARGSPFIPFKVKYLDFTFFKDFSNVAYRQSIRPGNRVCDQQVHDIVALKYTSDGQVAYKLDYSDDWVHLPQRFRDLAQVNAGDLYSSRPKIKAQKFHDLMQLKSVLPQDVHAFYDELPHL